MCARNAYKEGKRADLNPIFRNFLFTELFRKYPTKLLVKKFDISRGMLYHYKNGRIGTIPLSLLKEFCRLTDIRLTDLDKNITKNITSKELLDFGLKRGRAIRRSKLEKLKLAMPDISLIVENNIINVEKWLYSYTGLLETCFGRKITIKKSGNRLNISYENYSKGIKKMFSVIIPARIKIDREFQYFFGLWCGDRVGGGRIGVANKQPELNLFTELYLEKMYQKARFVVLKSSKIDKMPDLQVRIDEIQEIKNMSGNFTVCVFSVNGILRTFFHYLLKNLDILLEKMQEKNIFFAGLFDAEGNIYIEDRCFRWACKNRKEIEIYKRHLSEFSLFDRYDGSNLTTKNIEAFSQLILPFIRQKKKINNANLVIYGKGEIDDRFKNILSTIEKYPGRTERRDRRRSSLHPPRSRRHTASCSSPGPACFQ